MKYKSIFFYNTTDILPLKEEWDTINSKCTNQPFLSFTWVKSWAEFLSEECSIFIVSVRDEVNKLVGIAPLGIFKRKRYGLSIRTLSFIANRPSDYQDFLVQNGEPAIILKILESIYDCRRMWDVVELVNFPFDSPHIAIIKNNHLLDFRERIGAECPRVEFNGNNFDLDSTISKKMLQDVAYQIRRLEKTGTLVFHKVTNEAVVVDYLKSFCELHKKRWDKTPTKSPFNDDKFKSFFIELGTKMFIDGNASCAYLTYEQKMVAGHFGFRSKTTFYYYYPAYDPCYAKYSIGKVFLYLLVKSEADANLRVFDFLRGAEEYKKNWGTVIYRNVQFNVFKFNLKGWLLWVSWFYNKNREHFLFKLFRKLVMFLKR